MSYLLCLKDNDSNQANRSDSTDDDPFIKPEVPGMSEEPAKPEDRVQEYISNLRGNSLKLHYIKIIVSHKM